MSRVADQEGDDPDRPKLGMLVQTLWNSFFKHGPEAYVKVHILQIYRKITVLKLLKCIIRIRLDKC